MSQAKYYSDFAAKYRNDILASPDPSVWASDIAAGGLVSKGMKARIEAQKSLITRLFKKYLPILDVGCGFGRQAFMMAREGYSVTGVDTNPDFIRLAEEIFKKHSLRGDFHCVRPGQEFPGKKYSQVVLFDVIEHLPPSARKKFIDSLTAACEKEAVIIISLPDTGNGKTAQIKNLLKYFISPLLKNKEHPYPVPGLRSIKAMTGGKMSVTSVEKIGETWFYVMKKN